MNTGKNIEIYNECLNLIDKNDSIELIKALEGKKISDMTDEDGWSLIKFAISECNYDIFAILLDKYKDGGVYVDIDGDLLHHVVGVIEGCLSTNCENLENLTRILKKLISEGFDLNKKDDLGSTVFDWMYVGEFSSFFEEILTEMRVNVNRIL